MELLHAGTSPILDPFLFPQIFQYHTKGLLYNFGTASQSIEAVGMGLLATANIVVRITTKRPIVKKGGQ